MLRAFAAENFRSIRERQELSFEPISGVRGHEESLLRGVGSKGDATQWLPSLILFGRNASGKSAFLLALLALKGLVKNSGNSTLNERIRTYTPHVLDSEYMSTPTTFDVDFVADDGLRYQYMVSYSGSVITSEALHVFKSSKRSLVYVRVGPEGSSVQFGPSIIGPKSVLKAQLLPNQLVLSKGANSNFDSVVPAYSFITNMKFAGFKQHELALYDAGSLVDNSWFMGDVELGAPLLLANRPNEDPRLKHFLEQMLIAADTSISGIRVSYTSTSNAEGKQTGYQSSVFTRHTLPDREIEFPFSSESQGTQRILTLAIRLYDALMGGTVLIIDEIDRSLHSAIVWFMYDLFGESSVNVNGAQLIASAHDVALLDEELFRRDQIVFIEKEVNASTSYTLADIRGVKPNVKIRDWYVAGRFGANPTVGPSYNLLVGDSND